MSNNPYEDKNDGFENVSSTDNDKTENSYEWNANSSADSSKTTGGEYHYSYVNGNNENASHNPNRYENAYSEPKKSQSDYSSNTSYSQTSGYTSNYSGGYANNSQNPYGSYSSNQYGYNQPQGAGSYNANQHVNSAKPQKAKKPKKPKKPASRGFVAAMLVVTVLASALLGFGGGYLANSLNTTTSGNLTINKVNSGASATSTAAKGSTTEIVQKTADSVVEISTESVVTGSFAQQYIQQGAGSGVIISADGYIITNYHVIEGANSVTVTLRDSSEYEATIVGSDEDSDIALIKIDADGLTAVTFGDSSQLAVGDYVVAIGNPLGELGGTVTDGIISALAREVTIEDKQMTLLQTNAQISPGNSGGGLFNANGELVGIVNAKDSATEVEGIAFAIPINNVLDILGDLKEYGYVTGRVDLGMKFTDITSEQTAFYYGVNRTGCYVLSVDEGSNAEKAGFVRGDLIISVNGTEISSSSEIASLLEDSEVGDTVQFTVYRRGTTQNITLELEEYVPTGNTLIGNSQQATTPTSDSDSIWNQMFGW